MRKWIAVVSIETKAVLYSEQPHPRRDISSKCAEAMGPGTVWGKGDSLEDAVHNARTKAAKHAKSAQSRS